MTCVLTEHSGNSVVFFVEKRKSSFSQIVPRYSHGQSFLSTTSAMRDDDSPPPPLWPPAVMELSLNEACRQRQSGHQSGRGGREGMGRLPTLDDARRSVIEKSGEWVVVLLLDDDKVSAASGGGGMEKTRITMREIYFP